MSKIRIFAVSVATFAATLAIGAHTVGNPGDPLRLLVRSATVDAQVMVVRVASDVLTSPNPAAITWYEQNRSALGEALRDYLPEWVIDVESDHCAEAVRSEMKIYFYYSACRDTVRNNVDAILLAIHEATHLVGNQEEQLADDVALAVYTTWLNLDGNRNPRWDSINPNGNPRERSAHASVGFTDEDGHRKLFVWGGCNEEQGLGLECSTFLNDGGIYDLQAQAWTPVAAPQIAGTSELELARAYSTAVFTGVGGSLPRKILIFGGCSGSSNVCTTASNSILAYDLATNSWEQITTASNNAPAPRFRHHAFWANDRLLVWGGIAEPSVAGRGRSLGDTWSFDPTARVWSEIGSSDGPAVRRFASATLINNDSKLLVFGGCDRQVGEYCQTTFNDGGILDIGSGTWERFNTGTSGFRGRALHSAVWTGSEIVFFGGRHGSTSLGDGAIFNPASRSWNIVSSINSSARYGHSAVWARDRMIVYGGKSNLNDYVMQLQEFLLPTGSTQFGQWREPVTVASPVSRVLHSAFWVDDAVIVWGGMSEDRSYLNSGGLFYPNFGQ